MIWCLVLRTFSYNLAGPEEGVTIEEFVVLWQKHVHSSQDEVALRKLFIKIDAACTSVITWRDFIYYTWVSITAHRVLRMLKLVNYCVVVSQYDSVTITV